MQEGLISVVVPVYKVEKYLNLCVDSILNQSYTNLEIILVDDGSPDNCPAICDAYAEKDPRIKVIHKENGGLSDARNAGIEVATGKYLGFVDSDDYIAPDMYEKLYSIITENSCDMAICQAAVVQENEKATYEDSDEVYVFESNEALYQMISKKLFTVNTWNKLYKRELFDKIRFPKGMLYEDLATTYKLILLSGKVAYSPMKKYAYLQRQGSIMNLTGYKVKTDKIKIVEEMLSRLKDQELQAGMLRYILNDIYKMASCGNLTENKEYLDAFSTLYNDKKEIFKNRHLSLKEKAVLSMAAKSPRVLQMLYKR